MCPVKPPDRSSSPRSALQADDLRQRLQALPCERVPPYDWQEFRRRERERRRHRPRAITWQHAAAAAGVTLLIAGFAILGRSGHEPAPVASNVTPGLSVEPSAHREPETRTPAPVAATQAALASRSPDAPSQAHSAAAPGSARAPEDIRMRVAIDARANETIAAAVHAAVAAQLAALERVERSQQWLSMQPAEPAVVRVGPRLAVASLEDRIAWVDDALTQARFSRANPQRVQALQQERERLVNSLAQVRYAEALVTHAP